MNQNPTQRIQRRNEAEPQAKGYLEELHCHRIGRCPKRKKNVFIGKELRKSEGN
jgi:hypothetical protein